MTWNSRDKLNAFHAAGAIGVAAIIAGMSGSWVLFVLIAASLLAASLVTGEVRPPQRGRKKR